METAVNNEDILTEILVLPFKSLIKFKCVCKHWLALISSHAFFTRRRRSYLNSAGALRVHTHYTFAEYCLTKHDSYNYDSLPFDVFKNNKPFLKTKIIQSCNGLFLCCDNSTIPRTLFGRHYNHTHSSGCCVWNPTSKKYTSLPPLLSLPCSLRGILSLRGISLAFDPSKSVEYKVVAVCQYNLLENCYQIQIYSSKAGTWRVSVRYFNPPPVDFLRGVFCDGAIHWNSTVIVGRGSNLYFDIDEEQVKTLKIPRVHWFAGNNSLVNCFQVSRGGLLRRYGTPVLLRSYGIGSNEKFDVYQLCKDCSGWSVKYRVDLPESLFFLNKNSRVVLLEKKDKSFNASYDRGYDDGYQSITILRVLLAFDG